jgi:hypothetical protein
MLICFLLSYLVEVAEAFKVAVAEVMAGAGGFPVHYRAVLGFWVVVWGGGASV